MSNAESTNASQQSTDLCTAAGRGDLAAVTELLNQDPSLAQTPDAEGRYPLHWAALNDELAIVHCLLKHGSKVEAKDHVGMTALHWAAFHGALSCLEALIQAGGSLEARDSQGYTVAIVAAQHGQLAMLHRIVVHYGACWDAEDDASRKALHWAAYNGYADVIRFLVVLGADVYHADRSGCTALHCAASRGETEACDVLVQAACGPGLLHCVDQSGMTPAAVARTYHKILLADRLEREADLLQRRAAPGFKPESLCVPFVWAAGTVSVTTFVWKVVGGTHIIPPPFPWMQTVAMIVVVATALGFIALYQLNVGDPGIVPLRSEKGGKAEPLLQYLDCPTLRGGHWKQLCVTCKIIRPLRAKHDNNVGRCIEVFDHYCPWVGNAIGRKNRHHFLCFVGLEFISIFLASVTAVVRLHQSKLITFSGGQFHTAINSESIMLLLWMLLNLPLLFALTNLAWFQTFQVLRNMTTNEYISWPRYPHFRHPLTQNFFNPFDAGPLANLHETCFPDQYSMAPTVLDEEKLRARILATAGQPCCQRGGCRHSA